MNSAKKQNILLLILIIFYTVGLIGLHTSSRQSFLALTPFNLLLSFGCLYLSFKDFSLKKHADLILVAVAGLRTHVDLNDTLCHMQAKCHRAMAHPMTTCAGIPYTCLAVASSSLANADVRSQTPSSPSSSWSSSPCSARCEGCDSSSGAWRERINTDAGAYGGSNVGNHGRVLADDLAQHGQRWSADLTLPPLAVLWLQPEQA